MASTQDKKTNIPGALVSKIVPQRNFMECPSVKIILRKCCQIWHDQSLSKHPEISGTSLMNDSQQGKQGNLGDNIYPLKSIASQAMCHELWHHISQCLTWKGPPTFAWKIDGVLLGILEEGAWNRATRKSCKSGPRVSWHKSVQFVLLLDGHKMMTQCHQVN